MKVPVVCISALLVVAFVVLFSMNTADISREIFADNVPTEVDVGNTRPALSAIAENPASTNTSPTNVGSNVTFEGTATDPNGDRYYLALCKTNAITPGSGGAPTCTGGNWCISSLTNSGSQATCSYTALVGDAQINDWYAFACDGLPSGALCSTVSQGSGDSGSPFEVNHAPAFTVAQVDAANYNPGARVTWTTTASDPDSGGAVADTVKLIVCKTAGITGDACDGGSGDTWCSSSLVAGNPSCYYDVPVPTPDTVYNAYVYIVDNHNFPATGATQGSNVSYTVNNIAPVVSDVTINSGGNITLTESTTKAVTLTAVVTDNNACTDIDTVQAFVYRTGVGYSGCDVPGKANANYCYHGLTCSVVPSGNTCDGDTDSSAAYTCTANLQYHADPTDTGTEYPEEGWSVTILAEDEALDHAAQPGAPVDVLSLVGYGVTTAIDYGSLAVDEKNDPLDKITTITATGNVGLDEELSGTNMTDGVDGVILVSYQKYALAGLTAYASGVALSVSATEAELNCAKTTVTLSPATADTWWGLHIPTGTPAGAYTGTNTIVAVKGEILNW